MRYNPVKITTENGKTYTLDFDREGALRAESMGFVLDDVEKFPLTSAYRLFYFALYKNHPDKTYEWAKDFIDEQFGGVNGMPDGLIERLGQLYGQTFGSLSDESKNPKARVEL